MDAESTKANVHDTKAALHHNDHEKHKNKDARHDRHSGTGHNIKEQPKKGGRGGKGTWGSYEDDIDEAKREGEL